MNLLHLHPMLVHFPIALAIVALVFDLLNYRVKQDWLSKGSVLLTVLATLGVIAALLSGFLFTKPVAGMAAVLKEEHILYAVISTIFLLLASVIGLLNVCPKRKYSLKYLYTLLLLLIAIAISLTGMKGGSIVYDVWLF